jgi:hypothetical protein
MNDVARGIRRGAAACVLGSVTLGCGARSSLGEYSGESSTPDASARDASTADAPHSKPDAAVCPSTGPDWTPSVVFEAPASYAIAADPVCGVSVVVTDAARRIHVMTLRAGSWADELTPWIGAVVAAASDGSELHVLYRDDDGLEHATRSDPKPELVDADGIGGEIVVDGAGAVHAIYTATTHEYGVHYAVKRGGWIHEGIDPRRSAIDPSLAVDRDGTAYAAYEYVANQQDHGCTLARRSGTGWTLLDVERMDEDSSSTSSCTCRLARDGTVHVAFSAYRPEGRVLRHAVGTFSALKFETVDKTASRGAFPWAAALDGSGALHVGYSGAEASPPPLKVAVLQGASTSRETVPATAGADGVLIGIDGADVTHLLDFQDGHLIHRARSPR